MTEASFLIIINEEREKNRMNSVAFGGVDQNELMIR
jgi:hypothetical protein